MTPTQSPQDLAITRLERAGFRFTCWFNAHDPENPDAQCATMTKRISRISHRQCEVDPDGSCNGRTVDAYLATLRD